jgi:hypothetical protein
MKSRSGIYSSKRVVTRLLSDNVPSLGNKWCQYRCRDKETWPKPFISTSYFARDPTVQSNSSIMVLNKELLGRATRHNTANSGPSTVCFPDRAALVFAKSLSKSGVSVDTVSHDRRFRLGSTWYAVICELEVLVLYSERRQRAQRSM